MINNNSVIEQTQITKRSFSDEMAEFTSGVADLVKDPASTCNVRQKTSINGPLFKQLRDLWQDPLRFEFHVTNTAN